ncbi:MAG TPA: DUF1326 domain-containing protein [Candidatus Acidoferrum sp.]|nr:DUF1326 domain-containing protein [Candidatus Acidoferrum sp.]
MWRVAGTYFESCNCDAVCPCRRTDGGDGGNSTHGVCDFALSWWVQEGHHGDEKLDGLAVVMAGSYVDRPSWKPWEVALLVDERASVRAQSALAEIFLGKAGGTPMANYTMAIGAVRSVRPAKIRLDHRRGHERIEVEAAVEVEAGEAAAPEGAVSCGIPGHDHPGTEVHAKLLSVEESGLKFRYSGVCGFTTSFDYSSSS